MSKQFISITTGTILRTILVLLFLGFLFLIKEVLALLFVAVILSSAFDPLIDWLQRFKIPRALSIIGVYTVVLSFVGWAIYLLSGPLTEQVLEMSKAFPDFYNKIISHNEVSREHPDRDKAHGRIWRIRYLGAKPPKPVNFLTLPTAQLPGHLKAPILWAKRAAWHQIVDRGAKELAPEVAKICADTSQDETTRILALWSLEGLKHYDRALMATLLKSDLPDLRREAVRAMGSMPVRPNELATVLKPFVAETHVMVRSQVLRTLADYGKSNPELIDLAVSFCLPDTKSEKLGGDYERKFERYLARMVLEQYPKELDRYLNSPLAAKQPESHLAWAEQALSIDDRTKKFLARWTSIKDQPLSEDDFKAACGLLRNTQVQAALKPIFDAPEADALVALAKKHALDVASPALGKLLQPACERMLESGDASRAMAAVMPL